MVEITLQIDAPLGQAIGIKEDLAMLCERYGDTRVVSVTEIAPEQMRFHAAKPGLRKPPFRDSERKRCK